MLARLVYGAASIEEATAELRQHWPEKWRTNERGERFENKWFEVMATIVCQEWEGRRHNDQAPREGLGDEQRRDSKGGGGGP